MGSIMQINSVAKFSDFSVLNSDFTRARCRVMYTGRNQNYTDITEQALNKLISSKGYANVPVVAHLYKGDDGKWRVGGHDCEIKLKDDGSIEFNDLTIPFGVVPEDCNPSFEDVVEASGEVKRYFCVDVLLWTHRYNIMDAAKSDEWYFNQSMEITINHCSYDNDGYCVIDDFSLSALCLLNHDPYDNKNEVEPCFPSASVKRFEMTDNFQSEFFDLLLNLKTIGEEKEENKLDFSFVKNNLSSEYFALSCSSNSVIAMRKKDFEIFEIPYNADAKGEEAAFEVVFDYKKAVKKYISVSDKDVGISSLPVCEYVEQLKSDIIKETKKTYSEKCESEKVAAVKELAGKLVEANAQIDILQAAREKDAKVIEGYKAAERQAAESKHRADVDEVIAKYSDKFYDVPDLFVYKSNLDYSKTPEQIEQDIYVILGKRASNSGSIGGKVNFSAASWGARGSLETPGKGSNGRYGDLFDKFDV